MHVSLKRNVKVTWYYVIGLVMKTHKYQVALK